MRIARHLLALILLSIGAAQSGAADLKAGLEAFRRQDYAAALREWTPLAEAGNRHAQFNLALMYADGLGVEQDHGRAAELFRSAAAAGMAEAQYELGSAYLTGRGLPADHGLSAFWLEKAARQGLANAQYSLAAAYEIGLGVTRDLDEAVTWYRKAAEQGHEEGLLRLVELLSDHRHEEVADYDEAIRWLRTASALDDGRTHWRLGRIFARGLNGSKDYARAIPFLLEAAARGIPEAHYELGLIYEKGPGYRDPLEARKCYETAERLGNASARDRLTFDPRLRATHLRNARIFDGPVGGALRVRNPDEIRRGPAAPVRFASTDDVYCDFFPRANRGGNPKFRCFLMTGPAASGGQYFDEFGHVRPTADAVLVLETDRGPRPVLAVADRRGGYEPLTERVGFQRRPVAPLELKVKYRSTVDPDPVDDRDMYSEVAATRLLWALHYPADRMYRVSRVHCHRCPRDPFTDLEPAAVGHDTTFENVAIELRYRAGNAENYDAWLDGGWSWGEELHRLRYGSVSEGFSPERRQHLDGLIVLMDLVRQVSPPPQQNPQLCLRGNIQQLGPYKFCPDTVLLVHDLGATFGKRQPDSLRGWLAAPVWADAEACEVSLPTPTTDEFKVERYVIGKAGQRFILDLLSQLTDEHLRAVFESAGFERFDVTLVPPDRLPSPEWSRSVIDAWIAGFRDKIEQVRDVTCEGS
jgi:TPR repeat protein